MKIKLWQICFSIIIIILIIVWNRLFKNSFMLETSSKINSNNYHEIYKLIKPGDVIIMKSKYRMQNLLIFNPQFCHAAICTEKSPDELDITIIQANMTKHVHKISLMDLFYSSVRFILLRPKISDEEKEKMVERVNKMLWKDYNTSMSLEENNKFYCSEIIYKADPDNLLEIEPRKILGRKYVTFEDIIYNDNFEILFDTKLH